MVSPYSLVVAEFHPRWHRVESDRFHLSEDPLLEDVWPCLRSFKSSIQIPTTIAANHWDNRQAGRHLSGSNKCRAAHQGRKEGAEGQTKAGGSRCSPVVHPLSATEPAPNYSFSLIRLDFPFGSTWVLHTPDLKLNALHWGETCLLSAAWCWKSLRSTSKKWRFNWEKWETWWHKATKNSQDIASLRSSSNGKVNYAGIALYCSLLRRYSSVNFHVTKPSNIHLILDTILS